jgi:hypothetical protein
MENKLSYAAAAKKYGTTMYEGTEYALTTIADYTSRLMPTRPYSDVGEGETYNFEVAANAIDENGNEYRVSWEFSAVRGEEPELDAYDYREASNLHSL